MCARVRVAALVWLAALGGSDVAGPGEVRAAPASLFAHEAQLFGHGDPVGGGGYAGSAVSVFGDTAVVGAPFDATGAGVFVGSVQVFVRSGTTWTAGPRLTASDGAAGHLFGTSVSIWGDTLVVGAPGSDSTGIPIPGFAYVFVRAGSAWTEQQKLVASDGAVNDRFGTGVSFSGDTVVVGAPLDDTAGGTDTGSAYAFVRSGATWTEQQQILASAPIAGAQFGSSASLDGDNALFGATGAGAGSAHVFVRSGTSWTEQQALTAADGAPGDTFGTSVSISAATAVIGAPLADTPGVANAGGAYVFVRSGTTWAEQAKLLASDAAAGDRLGDAVSISAETVVAGAPYHDTPGGANAGSVYVFVRAGTTWTQQQGLLASDGMAQDFFGASASISGDTAVVGAWLGDTPGGLNTGTSYAFVRSGTVWTEQQELLGVDGMGSDLLGFAVSISGDTLVVGSPQDTTAGGPRAGAAYVFVRSGTTWSEQQKLVASDGAVDDYFGHSVSVHGDTAVVGALYDDTAAGVNAGSAYVFVRSGNTWTQQQKLVASDGAEFDVFGTSVSVFGDTAVVGVPESGDFAVGAAYVFQRVGTTWVQQQKLVVSSPMGFEMFGHSVSISEDTILVGKPTIDGYSGRAHVFVRAGTVWSQQQILASGGPVENRFFGHAVSLSGDTAVVGAPLDGTNAGAAYVFVRAGTLWTQQQKLVASDAAPEDRCGWSVGVSGDTVVVGSPYGDAAGSSDDGSAYVFERTGTTWAEQQELLAPDGEGNDTFGWATAVSGDTVVAGAYADNTSGGQDAGSAHVFRRISADLGVTKTDGQTTAVPGEPVTYTVVVSNVGPTAVAGATVTDAPPAVLTGVTWTCVPSPGSSCAPSGSGGINDTVSLLAGGTATYTLTGTVDSGATGTLTNTVTVTAPGGVPDPDPANNSATDVDTLTPQTDLSITKVDSADPVSPGDPLSYVLTVTNLGPSHATFATVVDVLPGGVTFVSSVPGPPTCVLAGQTMTCSLGTLSAGAGAVVTINTTVDASSGLLVNTATVAGSEQDPESTNDSATETTLVGQGDGELSHGTVTMHDLAAAPGPAVDEDVFRISQKPHSSYEVVVDATSGDIGSGDGPSLERVAADGTTALQDSAAIGTGSSRSLRWRNATAAVVVDEMIRVHSASCGTDCGPDDVYRIRAYETTGSVPRFNNAGTQVTVLLLHNPTSDPISGEAHFWDASGALVATLPFSVGPKATLVQNTATLPGAAGASGAVTVAHDGRYGDLSGKAVALEPATGFSFDSPLESRPLVMPPP